jgi:hypothetical protein
MNALQRITVGLLAAGALTVEIGPLLQLSSDLRQVPVWLRQLEVFRHEAERLEEQRSILFQVTAARQEVIDRLRLQELTIPEAIQCYRDLDSLRTSCRIPNVARTPDTSSRAIACSKLLGWLAHDRKLHPAAPGDSVLAGIEHELMSEAARTESMPRVH